MTNEQPVANTDIATEADIKTLVRRFYEKVRRDEQLGPIFDAAIQNDWDAHLQKMCDFWSTLLLYTRKYMSDPMVKHMPLPIQQEHFERWISLFNQTVDESFSGHLAAEAKRRAGNIARLMNDMKSRIQ
jgi:hemoglobin